MEQGLSLLVGTLLSVVFLSALFTVQRALFPWVTEVTRGTAETIPGRAFLVGMLNVLFLSILALGSASASDNLSAPIFLLPAFVLSTGLVIGLSFGLTGMVALVGSRLFPTAPFWRQTFLGALALILGCLTPFVGWFGLLPYLGFLGFGAFILGWFRRGQYTQKPPPDETQPM